LKNLSKYDLWRVKMSTQMEALTAKISQRDEIRIKINLAAIKYSLDITT
jgi:hypothetical protein